VCVDTLPSLKIYTFFLWGIKEGKKCESYRERREIENSVLSNFKLEG